MIIAQLVPATVIVVICEPRGISNPITMGIKTSKASWERKGQSGKAAATTKHIWWLTYANKSEKRARGTVKKLAMIKK